MRICRVLSSTASILLFCGASAAAQGTAAPRPAPPARAATLSAHRIEGLAPVVDGRLDEAVWAEAVASSPFTQREPLAGRPASERTEVRVLFDAENLYVGARMFDSQADSITSILARRDATTPSDQFIVALDTYRDRRTAFAFRVGPAGTRSDWMVINGRQTDFTWDAVWEARTSRDDDGWSAEIAIPLSQLRYAEGNRAGDATWGVNFFRSIARRGEWDHWALIPSDATEDVAHYGELAGVPLPRSARRLEVLPYVLGEAANGSAGRSTTEGVSAAVGADVKLGLTSSLTLTASVNPDFGQVEADPSQLNLSGREILLEERRPFFVEGADLFQGWFPQLFYSRRIGRAPQRGVPDSAENVLAPRTARILGAAKLTGKTADGWSIAFLDALTNAATAEYTMPGSGSHSRAVEPLTNYVVARIGRELGQGWTRLGASVTAVNRDIADPELRFLPRAAYTGGFDWLHRLGTTGSYHLRGTLQGSWLSGDTAAIARAQRSFMRYYNRPDADHVRFDPAATSLAGYSAFLRLARESGGQWRNGVGVATRSPGFEIGDLGFQSDADMRIAFAWIGEEDNRVGSLFRRRLWYLNSTSSWNYGGERLSSILFLRGEFQLRNYWEGSFYTEREFGGLDPRMLRGGPAVRRVPHTFLRAQLATDRRNPVSAQLQFSGWTTDEGGGGSGTIAPALVIRPDSRSELSLAPSLSWERNPAQYTADRALPDGRRWIVAELTQRTAALTARASYTVSPALSLQFYAQPFLSAARYERLAEVTAPRAARFHERFRRYGADAVRSANGEREIDRDEDGVVDFRLKEPDLGKRELNANAVLRWEYRRGSTFFLVWSHGRSGTETDGSLDLRRDAVQLFRLAGRNTLAFKLSYWFD